MKTSLVNEINGQGFINPFQYFTTCAVFFFFWPGRFCEYSEQRHFGTHAMLLRSRAFDPDKASSLL